MPFRTTWTLMINLDPMLNKLKKRLLRRTKNRLPELDKVLSQQITLILPFLMPGLLELRPLMDSSLKMQRDPMRSRESKHHKKTSLISSRKRTIRKRKSPRRLDKLKLNKSQLRRSESKRKLLWLPRPRSTVILRC